jgi:hypothetical protein
VSPVRQRFASQAKTVQTSKKRGELQMVSLRGIEDAWATNIEGWTLVAQSGAKVTYQDFIENVSTHAQERHLDEFEELYSDWGDFEEAKKFKLILGHILFESQEVRYRRDAAPATAVWSSTVGAIAIWNHAKPLASTAFRPTKGIRLNRK